MIHLWEAFLAGALVGDVDAPEEPRQQARWATDFEYHRDVPILMDFLAAGAREDERTAGAILRDTGWPTLLTAACEAIGRIAAIAVANGEAPDVQTLFANWARQAAVAPE